MYGAVFKVCIFGDGGVGKSCLVNRYIKGVFENRSKMTIGVEFLIKIMKIKNKEITLQLWDFAGENRFRFLLPNIVGGISGGIFMFDITRNSSLKNVIEWVKIFKNGSNYINQNIPIIMVGGKLDLHYRRSIYSKDAVDLANEYKFYDYIECSAKTGENVEIIFYKMARALTEMALLRKKNYNKSIYK